MRIYYRQGEQCCLVVILTGAHLTFDLALLATMHDVLNRMLNQDRHRLHQPTAGFLPVPRIHITMYAPEALGAVIGVAIAPDLASADLTDKRFDCTCEISGHLSWCRVKKVITCRASHRGTTERSEANNA